MTPNPDPQLTLEHALDHIGPRLTQGRTNSLHFNPEDEAAMLLRDAIFVLQSLKENSAKDVKIARRGNWQLRPVHE